MQKFAGQNSGILEANPAEFQKRISSRSAGTLCTLCLVHYVTREHLITDTGQLSGWETIMRRVWWHFWGYQVSQLRDFWRYLEDSPHKNFPKNYPVILLAKLVKWGGFEDILTSLYSSGVWVSQKCLLGPLPLNGMMNNFGWLTAGIHFIYHYHLHCIYHYLPLNESLKRYPKGLVRSNIAELCEV